MTDPRKIIQVTGQMRQMGEWGILLPDEAGQTDATLYFQTREEAEEYMREHPVCAYCASPIEPCLERASGWKHKIPWNPASGDLRCGGKAKPAEPPIPPTSALCEHCGKEENCHTSANGYCTEYGRVIAPLKRFKPKPEPQGKRSLWPKWCEEGDHPYFAISNGPTEYKCIICHLTEENDQAESALRAAREECDKLKWSVGDTPSVESGICHCGEAMEGHSVRSNHAPVDMPYPLHMAYTAERNARKQAEVKGWNDCVEAAANRAIQYGSTSIAAGIRALSKPSGSQSDNVTDNATK